MVKKEKATEKKTNIYSIVAILLFFNVLFILSITTSINSLEGDIARFKSYPFSIVDILMQKYAPADNIIGYLGTFFAWLSFYIFGKAYSFIIYILSFVFIINQAFLKRQGLRRTIVYLAIISLFVIALVYLSIDYNTNYSYILEFIIPALWELCKKLVLFYLIHFYYC